MHVYDLSAEELTNSHFEGRMCSICSRMLYSSFLCLDMVADGNVRVELCLV